MPRTGLRGVKGAEDKEDVTAWPHDLGSPKSRNGVEGLRVPGLGVSKALWSLMCLRRTEDSEEAGHDK